MNSQAGPRKNVLLCKQPLDSHWKCLRSENGTFGGRSVFSSAENKREWRSGRFPNSICLETRRAASGGRRARPCKHSGACKYFGVKNSFPTLNASGHSDARTVCHVYSFPFRASPLSPFIAFRSSTSFSLINYCFGSQRGARPITNSGPVAVPVNCENNFARYLHLSVGRSALHLPLLFPSCSVICWG